MTSRWLTPLSLLPLSVAACATEPGPRDIPPFVDGLTIVEQTPDHVRATFGKDGRMIELELGHAPRHFAIRDIAGAPLLESTLGDDGMERIDVLGGRETIVGRNGQQPTVTGDASAHDELSQLPEAALIPAALAALPATDLPEDLYRAQPDTAAAFQAVTLYCGQVAYLPTYSIWWSHSFVRYNTHATNIAWIDVQDFWAVWTEALLPGWYYNDYGPRWNFTLRVENKCYTGNTPVRVGSDAY